MPHEETKTIIKLPKIGAEIHIRENSFTIGNEKRALMMVDKIVLEEWDKKFTANQKAPPPNPNETERVLEIVKQSPHWIGGDMSLKEIEEG